VLSITPAMKFVMNQSVLQSRIVKRIDSELSVHGISFTEFMVMYLLSCAPNNTLRRIDLAERIGLSASGVTRLLVPMEKRKMVQRETNPRDARVSLVKLSSAGQQLFKDALVSYEHAANWVTQHLDSEQLGQMLKLTEKML
jgi:DNA-binding MarR family transcriptional regulator